MKIVYCIRGLYNSGGMERVLANKVNWLVERGWDVNIVTTDQKGRGAFFQLDPRIDVYDLGVNYEDTNGSSFLYKCLLYPFKLLQHKRRLKQLLHKLKADITISMFCNDASFLWKINDGSKKILEIHFSRYKRLQYDRKGIWRIADIIRSKNDRSIAKKYDKFVVLTNEDKDYWGTMDNIMTIPNARSFRFESPASLDGKLVIAVGRYSYQKGYDRLLRAWKQVSAALPDAELHVVGEGELRDELLDLVESLGISESVRLGKATKNIEQVYLEASLLVMTSHYEGLPMVLLEAQAAGLPIVSFNCKCGPKDVIEHGESGYLIENGDIDRLAKGIIEILSNDSLRKSMGRKAFCNSENYDERIIMEKWVNMFETI